MSYAWRDDTPEGIEREAIVDQLCAAAEQRGINVIRDKTSLGLGERISKFMQRLARGNRVFVVLSDKYLKSPYCMSELFEVWRNCRQDDQEFLSRIRVYTLPDAKIWTPVERAQCAVYWKEESERMEAMMKVYGYDILGDKDFQYYKLMKDFSHHVGDILATVTDILQPRSFEEFEKYGLHDVADQNVSSA